MTLKFNMARAIFGCDAYNVDGYLHCKKVDATWHPGEKPFGYCHCKYVAKRAKNIIKEDVMEEMYNVKAPLGCEARTVDGYLHCDKADVTWNPSGHVVGYCHCKHLKTMANPPFEERINDIPTKRSIDEEDQNCRTDTNVTRPHFHRNAQGRLVECYHVCRSLLISPAFWFGTFITWPIEHYLWEKVWPFNLLAHYLGL